MDIKIDKINNNKITYIFGLDKVLKVTFNIQSIYDECKINCIYLESGVHILLNGVIKDTIIQKFIVTRDDIISSGNNKTYSIDLPITYPNIYKNKSALEIKNYYKINIINSNNKSIISQEIYPNIILEYKERNGVDINLCNITKEQGKQLLEDYKNSILKIENLLHSNSNLNNSNNIIDSNTKELSNKVSKGLQDLCSNIPSKDNIDINKGFFSFSKNYVNKKYYEYIYKKFLLFYLREKLRNNIYIKSIYIFSFITVLFLVLFNERLNIIEFELFNLWLIFIIIFSMSLPYFILLDKGLKGVRLKIIQIIPNKKNILQKLIINKNINVKSIFRTIEIDYYDNYTCEFNVYLGCNLVGSRDNQIYNTDVYMINIGYYKGDKFHINKINDYTLEYILENMYIKPGKINKRSLFKIAPTYASIQYSIIYSFQSIDISDKYENIII